MVTIIRDNGRKLVAETCTAVSTKKDEKYRTPEENIEQLQFEI
jgi:hypothetical protein